MFVSECWLLIFPSYWLLGLIFCIFLRRKESVLVQICYLRLRSLYLGYNSLIFSRLSKSLFPRFYFSYCLLRNELPFISILTIFLSFPSFFLWSKQNLRLWSLFLLGLLGLCSTLMLFIVGILDIMSLSIMHHRTKTNLVTYI